MVVSRRRRINMALLRGFVVVLAHTRSMSPDFFLTQPLSTPYLGSRRKDAATGEGPIFEVMANTPFIPTIRPGGVRRELAVVDPHGRFVRWLANKP